ncbi:MAG: hypothetical protein IJI07_07495 [Flexilinea sp.]|nr:hypothetical protein [Flexilinea sp.]
MKQPVRYRPQGQMTRGKTARNRLRRSDIFMLLTEGPLIRMQDEPGKPSFYVDLGYGFEPFTTLETAERLRVQNPHLPVLGVEIDPERVKTAEPYADDQTFFRLGGFNLPLHPGEQVRLIRAFNVLRQYEESEWAAPIEQLGQQLIPGGMLLEGTSNPFGSVWTANIIRRSQTPPYPVLHEGYLFSTNFHMGFEPDLFQPVLTKNCIHRMVPGEQIYEFMERWKTACRNQAPMRTYGLRALFCAAAGELRDTGYAIDLRPQLLRRGFLLVKNIGNKL